MTLPRQIEVAVANGKTTPQACKEAQIWVLEAPAMIPATVTKAIGCTQVGLQVWPKSEMET